MYVSHDKKLVFIRVPKTGSSAVIHLGRKQKPEFNWDLTPYDFGYTTHVMVQDLPIPFKVRYKDYTWMAGIRNPATWIPSFMSWCQKTHEHNREMYLGTKEFPDNPLKFLEALRVTPASWSFDPDGIVTVHSYKQENPKPMERILGFPLAERVNRTASPRSFELKPELLDLYNRKFFRELPHYEPL